MFSPKVEIGQGSGFSTPAIQKYPLGQSMGRGVPRGQYDPAGHTMQAARLGVANTSE